MPSPRFALLSIVLGAIAFVNASPLVATSSSTPTPTPLNCTQPNLSDDPSQWSSRHFIKHHYPKPIMPTPIFWSGRVNGTSVAPFAVDCANKIPGGGVTIGMLMCQLGGFTMPKSSSPDGNALWNYASELLADYTKGDAYTVIGDAVVTSTWFDVEFPNLLGNNGVKSVISLDPTTCAKKCYWDCPDPNNCQVGFPTF
jgi:hypothetical protein